MQVSDFKVLFSSRYVLNLHNKFFYSVLFAKVITIVAAARNTKSRHQQPLRRRIGRRVAQFSAYRGRARDFIEFAGDLTIFHRRAPSDAPRTSLDDSAPKVREEIAFHLLSFLSFPFFLPFFLSFGSLSGRCFKTACLPTIEECRRAAARDAAIGH